MGWKEARRCSGRTQPPDHFAAGLKMKSRISNVASDFAGQMDSISQNNSLFLYIYIFHDDTVGYGQCVK